MEAGQSLKQSALGTLEKTKSFLSNRWLNMFTSGWPNPGSVHNSASAIICCSRMLSNTWVRIFLHKDVLLSGAHQRYHVRQPVAAETELRCEFAPVSFVGLQFLFLFFFLVVLRVNVSLIHKTEKGLVMKPSGALIRKTCGTRSLIFFRQGPLPKQCRNWVCLFFEALGTCGLD